MDDLVKIKRPAEAAGDGPTEMEVPAAELETYRAAGWELVTESGGEEPIDAVQFHSMTNNELRVWLSERTISFPANANKTALLALCRESFAPSGNPPVHLVKMARPAEASGDGPLTADVHPDEVENFQVGGWQIAE